MTTAIQTLQTASVIARASCSLIRFLRRGKAWLRVSGQADINISIRLRRSFISLSGWHSADNHTVNLEGTSLACHLQSASGAAAPFMKCCWCGLWLLVENYKLRNLEMGHLLLVKTSNISTDFFSSMMLARVVLEVLCGVDCYWKSIHRLYFTLRDKCADINLVKQPKGSLWSK